MASTALTKEATAKFIPIIDAILFASDLSTVSVKKVRTGLQTKIGYDITPQKKQVDSLITERFDNVLAQRELASRDDEEGKSIKGETSSEYCSDSVGGGVGLKEEPKTRKRSATSVDEDARLAAELHAQLNGGRPSRSNKKKPTKSTPKGKRAKKSEEKVHSDGSDGEKTSKKKRKGNPNSAFMVCLPLASRYPATSDMQQAPLILSEPLANLLGETMLSRPETVKRIWAYVKARDLQDPDDKRYIICDDSMKAIFGNKIHMCTMNKVLAQNLYKPEEKI